MSRKQSPEWISAKYGMELYAPYNEDFTKEMKVAVPESDRKWLHEKKAWWISEAWVDEVDALLREHYEDYQ